MAQNRNDYESLAGQSFSAATSSLAELTRVFTRLPDLIRRLHG